MAATATKSLTQTGPVVGIAVKHEMTKPAGNKMVGNKLRRMSVVFQPAGKFQLRTAQAEIHRGLLGGLNKFGEIIAGSQPGENATAKDRAGQGNPFSRLVKSGIGPLQW
jgi:hypothetical protein